MLSRSAKWTDAGEQKLDFNKGSFYANPLLDVPEVSDESRYSHPEYVPHVTFSLAASVHEGSRLV